MRRNPWLVAVVLVLLPVSAVLSGSAFAQKRNITDKDLFSFVWVGDTQISPDGNRAVFVQTTVNAKHDGYATALYLLDLTQPGAKPRQLTNGPHDGQPRWSPDGKQLAFVRAVEKDGKPQPPQVFLLPMAGGEPMQLSSLTKGAGSPQWSPDGKSIAVVSEVSLVPEKSGDEAADKSDEAAKANDKSTKPKDEEHKSDVRVITKAVYRQNGEGYTDTKVTAQLFLYSIPASGEKAAPPTQLTDDHFGVDEYFWGPGGRHIDYSSEHVDEPYYDLPHTELYQVTPEPSADGKVQAKQASTLIAKIPFGADGFSQSPDWHRIAFHGENQPSPPRSHQQSDLYILQLDAQDKPYIFHLTDDYDYEMGSGVGGDNAAPRGGGRSLLKWSPDGKSLIDVVGKNGSAILVSVDATTGAVTELTAEKQAVQGFSTSPDTKRILALISTPINIGDLFSIASDGSKQQTQLTHVNEALFSQLNLTMPEEIMVTPTVNAKDIDNHPIETWVQRPPDFDPAKKYPLILDIHGGPHSAYGWVFDHEFQWFAAKGYVVVYPNPRGSTNYGQKFANVIQYNYPGDDFHDLMDSVDAVVKLGYVDSNKLGVTGGSGGGLLTDWTVTQTNRFKAAVAQRDITDWSNWWYTADFTLFQPTWFQGAPFEQTEEFKQHSPITYVTNIKTPMMFILGEADYRTPPTSGGEDFFRALKYRHIDTVMVRFPGESHELSRSGQPWHRVERLENIINWFDKYLMGTAEPQYDVVPAIPAATK
jgi:dipeptidyl aminopeptidase/acylaminoacyl peptidase